MTDFEFKSALVKYRKSNYNASDDDMLVAAVQSVLPNISLSITASDCDSKYQFKAVKQVGGWLIESHWMYAKGGIIPDRFIAHDLSWLLRVPNARISVS